MRALHDAVNWRARVPTRLPYIVIPERAPAYILQGQAPPPSGIQPFTETLIHVMPAEAGIQQHIELAGFPLARE